MQLMEPAAAQSTPPLTAINVCYTTANVTQVLPWYAKEKGIFAQYGLDVNWGFVSGGSKAVAALIAVSMLYAANFGSGNQWGTLLNGATVLFYDVHRQGTANLADWLNQQLITVLRIPIELYRQMLAGLTADFCFPTLRLLAPSGRIYRRDLERSWPHLAPERVLTSRFSSTEIGRATHMALTRTTPISSDIIPAGYPLPGVELFLQTEEGAPAAPGEIGQIYVRSRYLPSGYWRNLEQTAQVYQRDPIDTDQRICATDDWGRLRSDGSLEFLGRKDSRFKIRGYRVDLVEIEKALPEPHSNPQWERPLLDTPYQPPRTPLEEMLVITWQEVLAVEPIGVHDHFLDLGGNSVRAMQIHARLLRQLQSDLPARLIFECATVAEMALALTQQAAAQVESMELEELLATIEALA
jgi:acyl-CoA synthetase (AMP-forming)/AMP-acid ligase II